MGIIWGPNEVRTFGKGTAASTPPAQASAFSSSAFSYGSPAPAPTGGFFGSTTAPAPPGGGLFGSPSPAPAPSTPGLFGTSTPTPAPGSSVFGTPSPATGGVFGTQPAFAPAVAGIPAQAAIRTYMDETARQEAIKLQSAAEKLYMGYMGAKFVTIAYDPLTPEQRQWQWNVMHSTGSTRHPIPPTPPAVSERDWIDMCVKNPDPDMYMPVALVGAEALQTRLAAQQNRAQSIQHNLERVEKTHESLRKQHDRFELDLKYLTQAHALLRQRQLDVMRKVELVRCRNMPLQPDEAKLAQLLHALSSQVSQLAQLLAKVQQQAKSAGLSSTAVQNVRVALPDKKMLFQVLKEQRQGLEAIADVVSSDENDLGLLQQKVVHAHVPLPPPHL